MTSKLSRAERHERRRQQVREANRRYRRKRKADGPKIDHARSKFAGFVGEARTYRELVEILIRRRHEMGVPQLELDARAGLQEGYTGKLEIGKDRGGRNMGPVSTEAWLRSLGVKLIVVRDDDG